MIRIVLFSILCFGWLISCKPNKTINEETPEADRGPMVENYAKNLIIPSYTNLQTSLSSLIDAVATFNADRSTINLAALRQAHQLAYRNWQSVALYDFGPAISYGLVPEGIGVNTYPTNASAIEANISAGGYNFNTASGATICGFPAIDYLLYSRTQSDADIMTAFDDVKRRTYLADLVQHIKNKVDNTLSDWKNNYSAIFRSNLGVDVGSATSNIVNRLVRTTEVIKNFKVGVPVNIIANVLGDPNTVNPEKAEAYYSDSSLTQMRYAIKAVKNTYLGMSTTGVNGSGLDNYLVAIGQASLDATIRNQFNIIETKLDAIPETFSTSLNDNHHRATIRELHAELVTLVSLFKVDMTSAMGVMISYTDNDGD